MVWHIHQFGGYINHYLFWWKIVGMHALNPIILGFYDARKRDANARIVPFRTGYVVENFFGGKLFQG